LNFRIKNEFNTLKKVVLGIGGNFGGTPSIEDVYDPHSRKHVLENTFPNEKQIIFEVNQFRNVLEKYDVDILRPKNIKSINQIFSRDIGFVIDEFFFKSNTIEDRRKEIEGINHILSCFDSRKIINLPVSTKIEGGDVVVFDDYIFIGTCSEKDFLEKKVGRTNKIAVDFLQNFFSDKKIISFELKKSDISIENSCLHLDCCFQPLGLGHLLVCFDAFNHKSDLNIINNIFPKQKIIEISNDEMGELQSNVFSISENVVVSNKKFHRINNILLKLGYIVEEVEYSNVSKMGGLFRCSTLPLIRL